MVKMVVPVLVVEVGTMAVAVVVEVDVLQEQEWGRMVDTARMIMEGEVKVF